MNSPRSILLVPDDSGPLGLLAEGLCGARPPVLWEMWPDQALPVTDPPTPPDTAGRWTCFYPWGRPPQRRALVLAWQGVIVPEGCWRAVSRIMGEAGVLLHSYTLAEVIGLAHLLSVVPGGHRLIFLDSDNHEIPHA